MGMALRRAVRAPYRKDRGLVSLEHLSSTIALDALMHPQGKSHCFGIPRGNTQTVFSWRWWNPDPAVPVPFAAFWCVFLFAIPWPLSHFHCIRSSYCYTGEFQFSKEQMVLTWQLFLVFSPFLSWKPSPCWDDHLSVTFRSTSLPKAKLNFPYQSMQHFKQSVEISRLVLSCFLPMTVYMASYNILDQILFPNRFLI